MQAKSIAALTLAFVISLAAIAGERQKDRIVVEIDDGTNDAHVRVHKEKVHVTN
jgi:hypothetical protein